MSRVRPRAKTPTARADVRKPRLARTATGRDAPATRSAGQAVAPSGSDGTASARSIASARISGDCAPMTPKLLA